jgi:hypothetical protein
MKYGWINSAGLQTVLKLISSSSPELTMKELRANIIEEVLFGDYRRYRLASGRWPTNWRMRTYTLLMNMPDLPEELIRKGVERIFNGAQWFHTVEWTAKVWFIPNLPSDLKEKFLKLNHESFVASKEIKEILDEFLPLWLAASLGWNMDFRQERGVALFENSRWELLDDNNRGALICCGRNYRGPTKVVLLPDVSGSNNGSAIEVSSDVKTVHGAISWMFQQDPEKWKGFNKEV